MYLIVDRRVCIRLCIASACDLGSAAVCDSNSVFSNTLSSPCVSDMNRRGEGDGIEGRERDKGRERYEGRDEG